MYINIYTNIYIYSYIYIYMATKRQSLQWPLYRVGRAWPARPRFRSSQSSRVTATAVDPGV